MRKASGILWKDFIFGFLFIIVKRLWVSTQELRDNERPENYCYQESAVKKKKKTLEKTSRCDRFKTKAFPLPLGHFLLFFLIAFSTIKFYQIAKLLTWGPGKSKAWWGYMLISILELCTWCLNSKLNLELRLSEKEEEKKKMWLSTLPVCLDSSLEVGQSVSEC